MQLFLDMDGVLADFDEGYFQQFGVRPSTKTDNVDWQLIRDTRQFYFNLPPMPDMAELWDAVKHLEPIVLTGVPARVEEARGNKHAWVRRHLGSHVTMIGCPSRDKCLHMRSRGDVLVDDWEKYKDRWTGAGGFWVTHTSAATTIAALRSLGVL